MSYAGDVRGLLRLTPQAQGKSACRPLEVGRWAFAGSRKGQRSVMDLFVYRVTADQLVEAVLARMVGRLVPVE